MQEPLQNSPSISVSLNLTEVLQWFPPAWRQQPSAVYNAALCDLVMISIEDGDPEKQRLRTYYMTTLGADAMHYICHVLETELLRLFGDMSADDMLKTIVMPSDPDIPGIIWLVLPNPMFTGITAGDL